MENRAVFTEVWVLAPMPGGLGTTGTQTLCGSVYLRTQDPSASARKESTQDVHSGPVVNQQLPQPKDPKEAQDAHVNGITESERFPHKSKQKVPFTFLQ